MTKKERDYFNCQNYLHTYWPKHPQSSAVWKENEWLLTQYVNFADKLKKIKPLWKMLDISTGAVLAPTLTMVDIVDSVQFTDYSKTSRDILMELPISYWKEYGEEIAHLKKAKGTWVENSLKKLELLRKAQRPVKVNIKKIDVNEMFYPTVIPQNYDLLTVHFVPDSITSSKREYRKMLKTLAELMKPQSALIMSALIETKTWKEGEKEYPSPNLKLKEIEEILTDMGIKVLGKAEMPKGRVTITGSKMGVLLGIKK